MQMEELIQAKVTQKENELNATYDEKMRNYEARFVSLNTQHISLAQYTTSMQRTGPSRPTRPHKESASRASNFS